MHLLQRGSAVHSRTAKQQRRPSAAAAPLVVRAVAEPTTRPAEAAKRNGAANGNGKPKPSHFLNVIPKTAWEKGIPPVMGAHLMASGAIAPISTSKGAGLGVEAHQFQYPGEGNAQVVVFATPKNASKGLSKLIAASAAAAIAAKGSFTLVLSGGSVLNTLSALAEVKGVDWSKWWVAFVDERNVDHASPDSNYKGAVEALLGRVPIPKEQVLAIREGLPVQQAATEYEGRLLGLPAGVLPRDDEGLPVFDLIVLGIGPDGHVASLFPNRPELAATGPWVLPVSASPKPPPERITFSLPVINAAKEVMVVALGESKSEIVQRVLEVQALPGALPAQLVRPKAGRARWVLDALAAQELNIGEWENLKDFPRNK
ncbi:6-phosphogluconolactonase [Raphidocelis subcapitata]|uniref:6-phosphogluconolactonase n=1 Tax=Raphidocelis subcapitata TaxID=307507 RepID=A0A2V0P2J4_9CHLO|nr:6-phosphogluconolactonase [Raphidocelis subcapitata]|eukprot:GBF94076.1 6-phosphogluconolactonase [Raphidocelis subcapitata]